MKRFLLIFTMLILLIGNSTANPFDDGLIAYAAGDYKQAVKYYKLSADQGDASAQFNLGNMYNNGRGVVQDYKEAVKYYRLSADQGYASAQLNLGIMYAIGDGVLQDYIVAHMWYNLASASGNERAGSLRDKIGGKMTSSQIEKAQDLASKCLASNYQDCM